MGVAIMVWQILMDRYSKGEFHVLLKRLKLFDHELFFKHIATRYFDFSQRWCLFCLIICCIQQFHWLIILSNISSDNSSLELSFVQLPKRKKKKKKIQVQAPAKFYINWVIISADMGVGHFCPKGGIGVSKTPALIGLRQILHFFVNKVLIKYVGVF